MTRIVCLSIALFSATPFAVEAARAEVLAMANGAWRYNSAGEIIGSFAEPFGNWTDAAVDFDNGFLYLVTSQFGPAGQYGRVWRYNSNTGAFGPISPPATSADNIFLGLALADNGDLLALSQPRIARIANGSLSTLATVGEPPLNEFKRTSIEVSSQNGNIYAVGHGTTARAFNSVTGALVGINIPLGGNQVAEGPEGKLYASNVAGVSRLNITSNASEQVISNMGQVMGVAFDPQGVLHFSAANTRHIFAVNPVTGLLPVQFTKAPIPGNSEVKLEYVPDGFLDMPIVLMPDNIGGNGTFVFPGANVVPGVTINFDPPVVTGYDYFVTGSTFRTVTLPTEIGDGLYELSLWNGSEYVPSTVLSGGTEHQFADGGIARFRITGIEISAGLDPADTSAFVTQLSFATAGTANVRMTPLTVVPEPSTVVMTTMGALALSAVALRKRPFLR